MRISDWSSDVCSSDLDHENSGRACRLRHNPALRPMLRNRKTGAAAHHASAWRPTWSPEPSHLRSAISVAPCFTARKMRAASLRHPGMSVKPVPLDIQCALLNQIVKPSCREKLFEIV